VGPWFSLYLLHVLASAILGRIADLLPSFRQSQCYFDATTLSFFNPVCTTLSCHVRLTTLLLS